MIWIGIDNGVTGSIGVLDSEGRSYFYLTPTKVELNYTKQKQNITRIDWMKLRDLLVFKDSCMALIERPLTGGYGFKALNSAMRSLESVLIVIEHLGIPFNYIDSKEWQRKLLPHGIKGSTELKKASLDVSSRLFPEHRELIKKHKDGDGLLIAHYCKLQYR
jgi:hypothetical protein